MLRASLVCIALLALHCKAKPIRLEGTHDTPQTAFELAALSTIVTISGSLVIALAVLEGALEPEAAFDAGHLDELWQAEQWGEDDFALDQRAAHRTDFLAACTFLRLLRG